jgi:hypothetical protein
VDGQSNRLSSDILQFDKLVELHLQIGGNSGERARQKAKQKESKQWAEHAAGKKHDACAAFSRPQIAISLCDRQPACGPGGSGAKIDGTPYLRRVEWDASAS